MKSKKQNRLKSKGKLISFYSGKKITKPPLNQFAEASWHFAHAVLWENQNFKIIGLTLARVAVVAGVLDIGENLLMLQTIAGNFTVVSLQMTHYFATIKFTLAAIVLIYLMISIPVSLRNN